VDIGDTPNDLTDFSSINGAVKGTEERDEPQIFLTWHDGGSSVVTNKVIYFVYLTWKHPRRWIEVIFLVTSLTFPQ
jgi:hypothetical protein